MLPDAGSDDKRHHAAGALLLEAAFCVHAGARERGVDAIRSIEEVKMLLTARLRESLRHLPSAGASWAYAARGVDHIVRW